MSLKYEPASVQVDNVLLELILAPVLREEPGAAVQAILPVIVGPAAEGGGFRTFPFYKLARLSEEPSQYSQPCTLHPAP